MITEDGDMAVDAIDSVGQYRVTVTSNDNCEYSFDASFDINVVDKEPIYPNFELAHRYYTRTGNTISPDIKASLDDEEFTAYIYTVYDDDGDPTEVVDAGCYSVEIEPDPDSDYWFETAYLDFEITEYALVYVDVTREQEYYSWTGSAIMPEYTVCTADGEAYTDYDIVAYKYDDDEDEYFELSNADSFIDEGDYKIELVAKDTDTLLLDMEEDTPTVTFSIDKKTHIHAEFTTQTVHDDIQVQLTHTTDNGLTGLVVGFDGKGRVFLGEFGQGDTEFVKVFLRLGLDGETNHRIGELHRLQGQRSILHADGVTRTQILESDGGADVAGLDEFNGVFSSRSISM